MRKKGFTLVEFAVSFCLIATIALLLFDLVLSIKNIYLNANIKTNLLNKQGIMLKRIYDDYNDNTLTGVSSCGLSCLTFTYRKPNNTTMSANLELDPYNRTITYDDYTIQLDSNSSFGNIEVNKSTISGITNAALDDSLLSIHIPINNELISGDYGMDINFAYKSTTATVNNNMNISDVVINLNGMNINIASIPNTDGLFAEVLSNSVNNLFASKDELKMSNEANKKSALFAIDLFKSKYNSRINTDVYEFVLMYPDYSSTEKNHWYQSSNFFKSEIENYYPVSIAWNNKWDTYGHFNGISKINDTNECGFLSTNDQEHANCYTTIGVKKLVNNKFMFNQNGTNRNATSMKLYVRCDDYINHYALSNVIR